MSEFPSAANSTAPTPSYLDACNRAKLIAAKIDITGKKRLLEDGQVPSSKKFASLDGSGEYQSTLGNMGGAVAGVGVGAHVPGAPGSMPQQMLPEQNVNEYIRVPDKMVGLIIGRGGEQISRLQSESGCKIQMAPDSGGQPDRVCTLTGSRDAVGRAKDMINAIVNQRGRDGGPPDSGPPQQRMGQNYVSKEEITIPGSKVGLIIGKGGETIKQLQEKSGAKMVVIQDGPNPTFEKPLRITGDPQKVEYAKQLVYELIAEKETQYGGSRGVNSNKQSGNNSASWSGNGDDFDQQNTPEGHEVLVPQTAVGVVIGKGGDMIKKIQAETGAKVQFHQLHVEVQGDRRCFLQGNPHQVDQAREMISLLIDSVNKREQDGNRHSGQRGPPRNGESGGGVSYGSWGGSQDNKIEVSFTVTNVKCGIIIGRGGEVIKQINAQSGAHCELDKRTQNNRSNRIFYIRGTPENVEVAKRIITEKVGMPINFMDSNSAQGNEGSNNGGGGGGGSSASGSSGDYNSAYGSGQNAPASGVGMWGYNPHWHPSQQQQQDAQPQQQSVSVNPVTSQPDYSQQWIEYYRSLGMMQEVQKIEQQQKTIKAAAASTGQQPAVQHPQAAVVSANGGSAATAGVSNVAAAGNAQAQPDYSAQWVEYYRNIGKLKEAEAIEAQMKQKAGGGGGGGGGGGAPTTTAVSAYGAGAPYQPQPYQQQHYPGYNPYQGYPAHQPHPAPPDQQ